jgi:hypothetical protein
LKEIKKTDVAAGLERSNVSRERLITRSDDGYFNTHTMIAGLVGIAPLCDARARVRRMTDSKFDEALSARFNTRHVQGIRSVESRFHA